MRTISDITPHQYTIEMGWDFTQIEDTARLGVSLVDIEILGPEGAQRLAKYFRDRVAEQKKDRK